MNMKPNQTKIKQKLNKLLVKIKTKWNLKSNIKLDNHINYIVFDWEINRNDNTMESRSLVKERIILKEKYEEKY